MIMSKEKTPYLIENKERDTFTFYVKGTKPYLDLEKKVDQLTNNWNELEEWLEKQKIRNNEWENFVQKDARLGIPIGYLLDKMKEIKEKKNVR